MNSYTSDQLDFIRENIKKMSWKELAPKFNETFGTNLNAKALSSTGKRYGIKSGRNGQFPKGHVPFNKGKKGMRVSPNTEFKKGNRPANWVPIGAERITKDGYVEVKVADGQLQKNWRCKHVLIWEEHNGPLPEGCAIIFGDGDKQNFDLDNLILVTRAQLVRMNQRGLIQNDADLTRTGAIIADVYNKIGERKRK